MTITQNINRLVGYGLTTGLIKEEDTIYTQNRLLELFQVDGFENDQEAACIPHTEVSELEGILKELLDYSMVTYRDLFDTKIMS